MRIGIVNDMAMAVEALRRVLAKAESHQVAWVARDGMEAVQRCAQDRPDLVLMDLVMPQMDGVEATRQIMTRTPCAVIVVTASVPKKSALIFEAMGAGALDVASAPGYDRHGRPTGEDVLLGKIDTIGKLIRPAGRPHSRPPASMAGPNRLRARNPLIAIGASAGGPAALVRVLGDLPPGFGAPVVVVQHVDNQFAQGLADWLDSRTPLRVRLAQEGDRTHKGTVLLAGGDQHLVFVGPQRVGYTAAPGHLTYRPSVDILFSSALRHWPGDIIGVVLTGMGRDGAAGLKLLHSAGHHTIVQDRATSAVYGMPKAATELEAASQILPLDKIGTCLANIVMHKLNS